MSNSAIPVNGTLPATLTYTQLDEIPKIHATLRAGFASRKLHSIAYRKYQLLQLAYMMKDNSARFEEALQIDLGRPHLESNFLEVGGTILEAKKAWSNVASWARTERGPLSINWTPMRPTIRKEPKGVVLIIAPFNYPVWLCLSPLAGALAAGNAVLLKPSEKAPATSYLIAELVPKYLDPDLVRVVNGGVEETSKILDLQWDHILYTGSGRVGKIVAQAAARNLTPVTLELGGKSPVVIDATCDLPTTARRLLWGKVINAGQTCVAPDYVLVPREFQDKLVAALKETHAKFYPEHAKVSTPGTYSRMVTHDAWERVNGLLKNTKGTIVIGGETDEATKYISPTVVKDVKGDDSLMSEEIFGPILPILPVADVDEAIAFINARDHPLALYVFSQDNAVKNKVFENTQSGSCAANEVVIHLGADGLPFGGTGASGSGYHTGKFSFDMFTHLRSAIDSPSWLDKILGARYPPYTTKNAKRITNLLVPSLPTRPKGPPLATQGVAESKWWGRWFFFSLALAVVGVLTKRGKIALPPNVVAGLGRLTGAGK